MNILSSLCYIISQQYPLRSNLDDLSVSFPKFTTILRCTFYLSYSNFSSTTVPLSIFLLNIFLPRFVCLLNIFLLYQSEETYWIQLLVIKQIIKFIMLLNPDIFAQLLLGQLIILIEFVLFSLLIISNSSQDKTKQELQTLPPNSDIESPQNVCDELVCDILHEEFA